MPGIDALASLGRRVKEITASRLISLAAVHRNFHKGAVSNPRVRRHADQKPRLPKHKHTASN